MKKIGYIIILLVIFIFGLSLGTKGTTSKNRLIDDAKNEFEEEITNPNNDYESIKEDYDENIFNSSADFIDDFLQEIIDKIKAKL